MQITNKSQQSKCKETKERESNIRFLRGSVNRAYIHVFKLTELEDSTIQALNLKPLKIFTIGF